MERLLHATGRQVPLRHIALRMENSEVVAEYPSFRAASAALPSLVSGSARIHHGHLAWAYLMVSLLWQDGTRYTFDIGTYAEKDGYPADLAEIVPSYLRRKQEEYQSRLGGFHYIMQLREERKQLHQARTRLHQAHSPMLLLSPEPYHGPVRLPSARLIAIVQANLARVERLLEMYETGEASPG